MQKPPEDPIHLVLLGIKYESAKLGGVDAAALATIEEGVRAEAGDGWEKDPAVLRGRNATRAEHGLPPVGERPRTPINPAPVKRPLWRRILGG